MEPIYDDVYFEALCFLDMQDGLPCSCGKHTGEDVS